MNVYMNAAHAGALCISAALPSAHEARDHCNTIDIMNSCRKAALQSCAATMCSDDASQ
jgi:hypothetical protein